MNISTRSRAIRPAVLLTIYTGIFLLGMSRAAWATPLQQPNMQTVPTKTPANNPDIPTVTYTPSATAQPPDDRTVTPTATAQPPGTPTITATPSPAQPDKTGITPTGTDASLPPSPTPSIAAPSGEPTATIVPIFEIPSQLPRTGAAESSWAVWGLTLLALVAGVGLSLWARRVDRE